MARKNKQPKLIKSHIKKGDTVKILSGENKGIQGTVAKVFPAEYRAIVEGEGIKMAKRHVRPTAETPGGIIEKPIPVHISNLMLVDANGEASKIRREKRDGKSVRISKKTQEVID